MDKLAVLTRRLLCLLVPLLTTLLVTAVSAQPELDAELLAREQLPTVKLSPRARPARLSDSIGSIHSVSGLGRSSNSSRSVKVSLDDIAVYLSDKRIVEKAALEEAGYLLGTRSGASLSAQGDVVYARGNWVKDHHLYDVVRPQETYILPATGEVFGIELNTVAEATLTALAGGVASMRITHSRQEVRLGDRLLPRAATPLLNNISLSRPKQALLGPVLGLEGVLSVGGSGNTVIIGLGRRDGLEVGHLLNLQRQARELRDERQGEALTLNAEVFGSVLVYRVFEGASLGLIIASSAQVSTQDYVASK